MLLDSGAIDPGARPLKEEVEVERSISGDGFCRDHRSCCPPCCSPTSRCARSVAGKLQLGRFSALYGARTPDEWRWYDFFVANIKFSV
jgi:hypothetical protein